jgi:GntR family transcriptional regulator, transcriptional repressor for pyruvate dehydrogenase complex
MAPHVDLPFTRIQGTSPSVEIVRQIKAAIFDGRLTTGNQLPPERELASLFHVSRVTVRDALRTLQANGLLEVRVGAKGGTFITAPQPGHVAESLSHMLALAELTAAEVTEARVILELGAMPLICERATPQDLAHLEEILEDAEQALKDGVYDFRHSVAFHVRLAAACHSRATSLMIDALHEPLLRSMVAASAAAPQMGSQGVKEHWEIVAAIHDRDARRAQEILAEHLGRTLERVGGDRSVALEAV